MKTVPTPRALSRSGGPLRVLLLLASVWGLCATTSCGRCSEAKAPAAATVAPPEAEPIAEPAPAAAAEPARAAAVDAGMWPGAPVDVLLVAGAPLLDPDQGDAALRAVAAGLRERPGVRHVWTRAGDGEVRMVVRFAAGSEPAGARRAVTEAWQADAPADFAVPQIATMARGERAVLGITIVAAKGRTAATKLADEEVLGLVKGLPAVTAARVAGAVRRYTLLQMDPVAMANYSVALQPAMAALRTTMAADSVRAVGKRLSDAKVPRGAGARSKDLPAVALDKLVIQTTGTGEPLAEAQVGRSLVTTVLAYSGHGTDLAPMFSGETGKVAAINRRVKVEGDQLVSHNLSVARRFVLTRATDRPPGPRRDFGERIAALLAGGGVYDALVVDGFDGIPPEVDGAGRGGNIRTLWLLFGHRSREEEIIARATEKLAEDGWRTHLLDPASDTALMWLAGEPATAGMLASSRNPTELRGPVGKVADMARNARSTGAVRSGPQRRPSAPVIASLNRDIATERRVSATTLAMAQRLLIGPELLGQVNDAPVWLSLPTDTMAQHNSKLPLVWRPQATNWGDLQQLPAEAGHTARLRADGAPLLWLLVDSALEDSGPFTDGFWQATERLIEPTPTLRLQPLRLDQTALGGAP